MPYYLDTNALLKFYNFHAEPDCQDVIQLLTYTNEIIFVSGLTLSEAIARLAEVRRKRNSKNKRLMSQQNFKKISLRLKRDVGRGNRHERLFQLVRTSDFQQLENHAHRLLIKYVEASIEVNDAYHLAIVSLIKEDYPSITLISYDRALRNVCQVEGINCYPP